MIETKLYNATQKPDLDKKNEIVEFLFEHLEQYGDSKSDILKSVDYAVKEWPSFGGFVLVSYEGAQITGVVVINQTGMNGYIPDNILVYIATHKEMRGLGIGKHLMAKAIELTKGDIALHVEPDNPARFLYEKFGFSSKYMEMRFKKKVNQN